FDVGIAEQHAVTSAAGMAMGGLRPVVAIYSTFLNRAWDQVVYDVAMHRLPVIFCLDRAGVTGPDGASHHGVYDMALMSKVPGMRVLVPSSAQELTQMLHDATSLTDEGPVVIRYARGKARQVGEHEVGVGILGRKVVEASDPSGAICVIAIGKMLETAEKAAERLADEGGPAVTVWDARCCAPPDPAMIADAAAHRAVVTIEDGIRDGGIGMAIATEVCEIDGSVPVTPLGLPTRFHPHDPKSNNIHARYGLDVDGLVATIRNA
ncbi:MAG: transketolase C-terminal domain-containing protein, partial [Ilumatobacter sp.]